MSDHQGKYVWYELMTPDMAGAEQFYTQVVGWTAKDAGMPGMKYTLMSVGEQTVAGVMTLPAGEGGRGGPRPAWLGYVAVDDVDASAVRVRELGGQVWREPADIPTVGRFSVVADPQGAAFVLFRGEGAGAPPPALPEQDGYVAWRELMTTDWQAAFDFYSALFGWTRGDAHDMGEHGIYQLFGAADGERTGGMMNKPAFIPAPPFWTYYFKVDGINAAVERIKAAGGQITHGPMQVPGDDWVVTGIDPQGAHFALFSHTA